MNVLAKMLPSGQQKLTCDYEHRATVQNWMKENKVARTTSTCKHERIGCAIAKGIHIDYTPEVIEFLEEQVDFKITSAKRFQEPKELGLFTGGSSSPKIPNK